MARGRLPSIRRSCDGMRLSCVGVQLAHWAEGIRDGARAHRDGGGRRAQPGPREVRGQAAKNVAATCSPRPALRSLRLARFRDRSSARPRGCHRAARENCTPRPNTWCSPCSCSDRAPYPHQDPRRTSSVGTVRSSSREDRANQGTRSARARRTDQRRHEPAPSTRRSPLLDPHTLPDRIDGPPARTLRSRDSRWSWSRTALSHARMGRRSKVVEAARSVAVEPSVEPLWSWPSVRPTRHKLHRRASRRRSPRACIGSRPHSHHIAPARIDRRDTAGRCPLHTETHTRAPCSAARQASSSWASSWVQASPGRADRPRRCPSAPCRRVHTAPGDKSPLSCTLEGRAKRMQRRTMRGKGCAAS